MFKKLNKKGFTLAELLVVVAIIAVLVAISIPIFTNQLEKSREAVDAANIRAAYAEVMSAGITGDSSAYSQSVSLKQQKSKWQNTFDFPSNLKAASTATDPDEGDTATITYNASGSKEGTATISIKLK